MANSGAAAGNFSGRTNYDLALFVSIYAYSGNNSMWYWELHARQISGADSYALDQFNWSVNVGGHTGSGTHSLDFRGATSDIIVGAGTTGWIAHDVNGNLWLTFSAGMGPASIFGSASLSGAFLANRIAQAPHQPPAPTFISATSSVLNTSITYPSDDGGSGVIDYTIELATDSGFGSIVQSRVSGAAAQTWTGLNPFTTYYMRYRARNAIGTGPNSPTLAAATLAAAPSAPLNPAISNLSPTGATLSWQAPTTDGGSAITGYRITRALDATFTQGVIQYTQGTVLNRAFTDLAPSTAYYFQVEALNSVGYGPASATASATTVSGVSYSNGTVWQAAGIFVSDGATWQVGEIYVSNGTAWVAAT